MPSYLPLPAALVGSRSQVRLGSTFAAACIATLSLAPATARATTTSGGVDTEDTTTTSTGTTGTDTDGAEDPSTDDGDWGDDDGCGGTCTAPDVAVEITAPTDGASLGSPFQVTVIARHTCACDTCGCWNDAPYAVRVISGADTLAACDELDCSGTRSFEVELPPGEHDLAVFASYAFYEEWSATVRVHVLGEATESSSTGRGDDGPTRPGGDGTSGSDTEPQSTNAEASSCSCTTPAHRPHSLGLTILSALTLRRRS